MVDSAQKHIHEKKKWLEHYYERFSHSYTRDLFDVFLKSYNNTLSLHKVDK